MNCNHILGMEEGVDEEWLVYADRGWLFAKPTSEYDGCVFKYCPLCGVELDESN